MKFTADRHLLNGDMPLLVAIVDPPDVLATAVPRRDMIRELPLAPLLPAASRAGRSRMYGGPARIYL